MSQYVPGVIDYVPDIQPYKPDLNFFQQVLQTKQAQYDVGYKKLSGLYGTLLNSPMLKHENIELRNKFFNDISGNIRKISGMDLSIEQNVNSARKVFQPLIDNDYIMKDMAFTKKYQQALDRHEYFKNCLDEKNCGGKYWTEGLKYINYQAEDFINSSLDESLGFENPEYVPYTNAVQKAVQLAKEMDFKVNNITKSGGYNIITENGAVMIPDLTDFFMSNFANDGNIRRVYDVLAYNKRKDYAKTYAGNFGGSEEQAEMNYLDAMAGFMAATTEKEKQKALLKLDASKNRQKLGEQIIREVGVDPNDPDDQSIINNVNQSISDQLISQTNADFYEKTNELVSGDSFNDSDLFAKRNRIDAAMADSLFSADMMNAASNYAKLTYKIKSYDADPFLLESIKAENARKLEDKKQKNRFDLAKAKGEIVEPSEEPAESDPAEPGSTFENADLYLTEETRKQIFGDDAAGATLSALMQANADLDAALTLENGEKTITGAVMSDDLRKEILRAKEYIFNQSEERKETKEVVENSLMDYLWTDFKGSLYSAWNFITGDTNEENIAKVKAYTEQELAEEADVKGYEDVVVNDKGFLDANGNVTEAAIKNNPSFYNSNSVNHYDRVFERLKSLYEDPANSLLIGGIGKPSGSLLEGMKNAENQRAIYKIETDRIAHNTALIVNSFDNMGLDLTDWEKSVVSQIAYGDSDKKYLKTKEDFVKIYSDTWKSHIAERKAYIEKNRQEVNGMDPISRARYINQKKAEGKGDPLNLVGDELTDEYRIKFDAAELYDAYVDRVKSEYNRADDSTKPYADFRTWNSYGEGGSGGQSDPYSIRGVDPRFPNTPGASAFKWTHSDLLKAINNPEFSDRIAVLQGSPGKYTAATINEAFEKGKDPAALSILQMIRDDIRQGNKKEDAARFDIQILPVAGGSPDLVAMKVTLNPKFIQKNKGGSESEGYTKDLFDSFSGEIGVIMPREAISKDNPAFAGLNRAPEDIIMDAYREVNLTTYAEYGGTAQLKKQGSGINYSIINKVFDPRTGTFIQMQGPSDYNTELTAGQLASSINEMLANNYAKQYDAYMLWKKNNKGNRITDPKAVLGNVNP